MKIAIIEDQDEIRFSVAKILKKESHQVLSFNGSEYDIEDDLAYFDPDLLILDVMLQTQKNGIELLKSLHQNDFKVPVILMTAFTTPENLIEASKLGIFDILQKPFQKIQLLELVSKYNAKQQDIENSQTICTETSDKKFIGSFETMGNVYRQIGLCANNDVSVLIYGQTGTGKELIAHLIHENSNRSNYPFIAINCASIPIELFESHFFGHEKGSFTSADKQHIGYAQQVGRGTLFLDEIGELDISLQSKLLRFLENKMFRKVGGKEDISFQGRIVCATNVDLQKSVASKNFREDLFFRLAMTIIEVPNLDSRKVDIPLFVEHFISLANKELHTQIDTISDDAMNYLQQKAWNGNIRELRNTIYNACLNANQNLITKKDIKSKEKNEQQQPSVELWIKSMIARNGIENIKTIHEDFERYFYEIAYKNCPNITKLATYCNTSRLTLRKIFAKYGIKTKKN